MVAALAGGMAVRGGWGGRARAIGARSRHGEGHRSGGIEFYKNFCPPLPDPSPERGGKFPLSGEGSGRGLPKGVYVPQKPSPIIRQRARELRQSQTTAENVLWYHLRRRNLNGHYFRRQHPIGKFIVDFYCAEKKLIVEIDGDVHAFQKNYDTARTEWLHTHGYHIIRFSNQQVLKETQTVLEKILDLCESLSPSP